MTIYIVLKLCNPVIWLDQKFYTKVWGYTPRWWHCHTHFDIRSNCHLTRVKWLTIILAWLADANSWQIHNMVATMRCGYSVMSKMSKFVPRWKMTSWRWNNLEFASKEYKFCPHTTGIVGLTILHPKMQNKEPVTLREHDHIGSRVKIIWVGTMEPKPCGEP